MAKSKPAPKSTYSDSMGRKICDLIAEGASLANIAAMPGMPARRTVRDWLEQFPDFERRYELARRHRTDNLVDEAIAIADSVAGTDNNAAVQAAKLQVDTRRWLASKLLPERFGDRGAIELTGPAGRDLIPAEFNPAKAALAIFNLMQAARPRDARYINDVTEVVISTSDAVPALPASGSKKAAESDSASSNYLLQDRDGPLPLETAIERARQTWTEAETSRLRLLQFPTRSPR